MSWIVSRLARNAWNLIHATSTGIGNLYPLELYSPELRIHNQCLLTMHALFIPSLLPTFSYFYCNSFIPRFLDYTKYN